MWRAALPTTWAGDGEVPVEPDGQRIQIRSLIEAHVPCTGGGRPCRSLTRCSIVGTVCGGWPGRCLPVRRMSVTSGSSSAATSSAAEATSALPSGLPPPPPATAPLAAPSWPASATSRQASTPPSMPGVAE